MIELTAEYLASQHLSRTFPKRFWAKVKKIGPIPKQCPELGPCWTWIGGHGGAPGRNYGAIGRGKRGTGSLLAHRASWLIHFGPIPQKKFVCHHCDNSICPNPAHLWVGTAAENLKDSQVKKRARVYPGAKNWSAKLTPDQVAEIRRIYRHGKGNAENGVSLGVRFGVHFGTINKIIKGRTWRTA